MVALCSVRNCNRRHRPLRWISILSRFCNVRLEHPHYVLCLLFQSDVDIACADHARKKRGRTIARLRHAAISLLPSVISRRRRRPQRIKACKGIRSSLTRACRFAALGAPIKYRVSHLVADLGRVDLDLVSSPGWWAATVATYCPGRVVENPKSKSTQPRSAT